MTPRTPVSFPHAARAALLALALCLVASGALAQRGQDGPVVRARGALIEAGDTAAVAGRGFQPGHKITLSAHGETLNVKPILTDDQGAFKGKITIPESATVGPFAVTVHADGSKDFSFDVKISRTVPLSGSEKFVIAVNDLPAGLYEVAYGAASDALFVTRSSGFRTGLQSQILKIDPQTLEVIDSTTPPAAPPRTRGHGADKQKQTLGLYAVFGVGVDDEHGTVWVTNTPRNTVAVYRQGDLSLVRQFPAESASHARDVVVDTVHDKAYVTAMGDAALAVFDSNTLQQLDSIPLASAEGDKFGPMGLTLGNGRLYVADLRKPRVAIVDPATGTLVKMLPIDGARDIMDVAWDAADKRLLVAAQGSDNLLIVDPDSGKTLHNIYVGAGALAVTWDPASGLAFVSTRGGGTIAVVDPASGTLVANLAGGTYPNHIANDGKGHVFAVNKALRGQNDPHGNRITRITPTID